MRRRLSAIAALVVVSACAQSMQAGGSIPSSPIAVGLRQNELPHFKVFVAGKDGLPAGARPWDIEAGADGTMWFTDPANGSIGTIVKGHAREFSLGLTGATPYAVAPLSGGSAWFTDPARAAVDEFSGGRFHEYRDGRLRETIVAGIVLVASIPWFVAYRNYFAYGLGPSYLGHVTNGKIALLKLPLPAGIQPDGTITSDTRGDVWFMSVDRKGNAGLVRARNGQIIMRFGAEMDSAAEPCCPNEGVRRLVVAPNGEIYFTTLYYTRSNGAPASVGVWDADGVHFCSFGGAGTSAIAVRGQSLWLADNSPFQIVGDLWRIGENGHIKERLQVPYVPASLTVDVSGNAWFTSSPGGAPNEMGVIVEVVRRRGT